MAGGTGRIVVGVDGSGSSRAALRSALEQARLTGAPVDAVMAWRYSDIWAPAAGCDVDFSGQAEKELAEILKQEAGEEPGMPVNPVVAEGQAAEVLLGTARDADLLVVGSRGRGGFTSMMVGSVSLHCVLHARCPVLVLRDGREGHGQE